MSDVKSCSHCHAIKPKTEFYGAGNGTDGLHSWCKACHRALACECTMRRYRERKAQGLCAGCGKVPPLTGQVKCARCQARNRNGVRRVVSKAWSRLVRLKGALRNRALRFGVPFDLGAAHLQSIVTETCPICGVKMEYFSSARLPHTATLDRIDPATGYVAGNVAFICQRCNTIKSNGTAEEHRRIADYIDARRAPIRLVK